MFVLQQVIKFDVYHDMSNSTSLDRVPSCAPIVNYSLGKIAILQGNQARGYKKNFHAQLRLKFILLINVKMPTIVDILTFTSRINYRL